LALKLGGGLNEISHDPFVVSDWGALRFDMHTGTVPENHASTLKVRIEEVGNSNNNKEQTIKLEKAKGTATAYSEDRWRIGYGETGFETFTIDVPDALRGKVATLKFVLDGGGEVYIDNVFFKSQSLLLGNPGEARKPDAAESYKDRYLLEKPQYTVSYNKDKQTANWSSYILNKSWLDGTRLDKFNPDPTLPSGWYEFPGDAYTPTDKFDGIAYDRGHLSPAADIARTPKDAIAADLMPNIIPQNFSNNRGFWNRLERGLRQDLVKDRGKELFVTTGNLGEIKDSSGNPIYVEKSVDYPGLKVSIPEFLWKVVLVSDKPISTISDVSDQTFAFAIYAPNNDSVKGVGDRWRDRNQNYVFSVRDLEGKVPYDFFSNLSTGLQEKIENIDRTRLFDRLDALFSSPITAPLLAAWSGDDDFQTLAIRPDGAVRHNGSTENIRLAGSEISSVQQIGINEDGTTSVRTEKATTQVSLSEISPSATATVQLSISEVGRIETTTIQERIVQSSISQVGFPEITSDQSTIIQIGIGQISLHQAGTGQVNSGKTSLLKNTTIQIGGNQIAVAQVSVGEVSTSQIKSNQISSAQINPTEISLTSSITLQQFLSIHNFNLQNTTIPTWTEFLTGTTPFNLNIEIIDLPTGQLAEANITGFDSNGRPVSGTLTLDTDANGLGWF
jgi:DNA/RNA endonuclease G (NUC1)